MSSSVLSIHSISSKTISTVSPNCQSSPPEASYLAMSCWLLGTWNMPLSKLRSTLIEHIQRLANFWLGWAITFQAWLLDKFLFVFCFFLFLHLLYFIYFLTLSKNNDVYNTFWVIRVWLIKEEAGHFHIGNYAGVLLHYRILEIPFWKSNRKLCIIPHHFKLLTTTP